MTIKDIETRSGMQRSNIRYYEHEGLIEPKRMSNGYRDYSECDLQILMRIKLLRGLHVSIDEIKALKDESSNLEDILAKQMKVLETQIDDSSYAKNICRTIKEESVTFTNLNAEKYLNDIYEAQGAEKSSYFSVEGDELAQVYSPWRRFFARSLDMFIYSLVWLSVLALLFHTNLMTRSIWGNILDIIVMLVLMLFIEPLLLRVFGTTAGKAVFGLKIRSADGSILSYDEGIQRTWGVIRYGIGFGIPFYNLYRMWKSYKACSDKETLPWDEEVSYTLKDTKAFRVVVYVFAYTAAIAVLVLVIAAQYIAPNRGSLTVSEFVENHNYYAKLMGYDFGNEYLDADGSWKENDYDDSYIIITTYEDKPEYLFDIEDGKITSVSFTVEETDNIEWVSSYDSYMTLVSLAFTSAQPEVGLFSKIPKQITDEIYSKSFKDYSFIKAGVTTECDIEYSGYIDASNYLLPDENESENYLKLTFTVSKWNTIANSKKNIVFFNTKHKSYAGALYPTNFCM